MIRSYSHINNYISNDAIIILSNISSVIADSIARAWDSYTYAYPAAASSAHSVYHIRPRHIISH